MDVVPFGCGDTRGGGVVVVDIDVVDDVGGAIQAGDGDVIDGVAVVAIALFTVVSTVFSGDMTEGCSLSEETKEGSDAVMS